MINFKKVTAIMTSALLIGMTMGVAAAANYPAPFVSSGTANVAVVYGASAMSSDAIAATNIKDDLAKGVTGSSTTGATATGDNVQLVKASSKINLGDGIDDIWTSAITDSNLPVLLADGIYSNDENTEYPYTQKVEFSNGLDFIQFSDSDYNDKKSSLGFKLTGSQFVVNYTLDWTTNPESDVTGGDLVDIETTSITMLGREYYILDFDNSTSDVTLLDAAAGTTLSEGDSTTLTVAGKTYNVRLDFINTGEVIFDIDGDLTNKLAEGGTYPMADGSYLGVKTINVQAYAGGTKNVEFSIGTGKLEIKGGGINSAAPYLTNCKSSTAIELNDVTINDITSCVKRAGASSGKEKLDKMVFTWKTDDEAFLAPNLDLLMPGFEALKFTMGEIVFPKSEETTIEYSGDDVFEIKTTIEDGVITLPILAIDTTANAANEGNFSVIGKDASNRLETGNGSLYLHYRAESSYNEGFIASWNNSKESESYYLSASVTNPSGKTNKTTITNKLTGVNICTDLEATDVCTIGNLELTIDEVTYQTSSTRNVSMHVNAGGSFSQLHTKEGLVIYLPYDVAGVASGSNSVADSVVYVNTTERGMINMIYNSTDGNVTVGHDRSSFYLYIDEEDKDETLGAGTEAYFTLEANGDPERVTVTDISGGNTTSIQTESSSKIYDVWLFGELATEILWDKSNTNQYSAKIIYHGDEVSADVFLSAPGTVVTSGGTVAGEIGDIVILDSEVTTMATKNLVVVGGSCINTVAANLIGGAKCTTDWETATGVGAGKYLIQSYTSPYSTGKIALLVAGYNAADTSNAQLALVGSTLDMTVGKKYTGTTALDVAAA